MSGHRTEGLDLIIRERERQIAKGFDSDHDGQHDGAQLPVMAALVACDGLFVRLTQLDGDPVDDDFGICDRHGEKGQQPDRIHMLAVAGALIAAEIDRLRAMGTTTQHE